MLFPIRCFTCANEIAHFYGEFERRNKENPHTVLDELGIYKMCCRMIFLTHASNILDVAQQFEYKKLTVSKNTLKSMSSIIKAKK